MREIIPNILNDREDHRCGIDTFAAKQAIRELCLVPFEMAVKEACRDIAAAFNGIGGALRGEWGFRGIAVTDRAAANEGYMDPDMGLRAGANPWLNTDAEKFVNKGYDSAAMANILRERAREFLSTVVNSSAMNGIDENVKAAKVLQLWQKWSIAADIRAGVIILLGVVLIIRRCEKNKA